MMIRKAACGLMMAAAFAVAGQATANLLTNPGFESPVIAAGVEAPGAGDGWTVFGAAFTQNSGVGITPNSGDQFLKMFGGTSGVFQDFAASEGQTWNGGVWMLNSSTDALSGGQVSAVNIEWRDGNGDLISFISNGTFDANAPQDVWTLQTVTGDAPAGTATARLVLITGNFGGDPAGGAPFYDDAFFEQIPEPGSLALLGLGGLALLRRRR